MGTPRNSWRNTTHDWAGSVDLAHLVLIRRTPAAFAPGGVQHLILEVLAYAADEAECSGGGRCRITYHLDGSVAVADYGRGTDTRLDEHGRPVKKPVMATKDLRFFDRPDTPLLPDGHRRRGMSTVAALSSWLIHTNRRHNGSWTQRYEHGVPASDLRPIADDRTTGTTVHFLPDRSVLTGWGTSAVEPERLTTHWPYLRVAINDCRTR
ncbi:ATP-binding protein [Streptomyces sp. NPDC102467]|uniref:ATP-binding protein n=1 Tax=Streptomyces sp. NPDC102467 TaxID=3366179 RepID=UPI003811EF00